MLLRDSSLYQIICVMKAYAIICQEKAESKVIYRTTPNAVPSSRSSIASYPSTNSFTPSMHPKLPQHKTPETISPPQVRAST